MFGLLLLIGFRLANFGFRCSLSLGKFPQPPLVSSNSLRPCILSRGFSSRSFANRRAGIGAVIFTFLTFASEGRWNESNHLADDLDCSFIQLWHFFKLGVLVGYLMPLCF